MRMSALQKIGYFESIFVKRDRWISRVVCTRARIGSLGKKGALLQSEECTWLVHSPKIKEKNPIGAGDSMVGGLVWALSQGYSLKESLGWGAASGAATASLSGTEVGSHPLIEELFQQVKYEEI
jgi:fructose-1-phosphate kinase PfkB-like protein